MNRESLHFSVSKDGMLFVSFKVWSDQRGRYIINRDRNPEPVTLEKATQLLKDLQNGHVPAS